MIKILTCKHFILGFEGEVWDDRGTTAQKFANWIDGSNDKKKRATDSGIAWAVCQKYTSNAYFALSLLSEI